MLTDYRSNRDLTYLAKPRRRFSMLRSKLLLVVFVTGAGYASLQFLGDMPAQWLNAGTGTQSSLDTDLALPGERATTTGETDSAFVENPQALDITLPVLSGTGAAEASAGTLEVADEAPEPGGMLTVADTAEATLATLHAESDTAVQIALPLPPLEQSAFAAEPPEIASENEQVIEQQAAQQQTVELVQQQDPEPTSEAAHPLALPQDDGVQQAQQHAVLSAPPAERDSDRWLEEKVKPGDSLARIFSRLDLPASLLHRIVNSSKEAKSLARIKPGQVLRVRLDGDNNLQELLLQRSAIQSLKIVPVGDSFKTLQVERSLEKRVAQATGTITDSLYQSAKRENLSDTLIMELANIFGWDIDFALEIRAGDQFSLVYEEEYLDGKKYRTGPILAAEFVNRGKVVRAVRYQDEKDNSSYFSPDGHSMRKTFLRAPVDFRRISSRFNGSRWHPVLGKKRPHKGVDYAARIGTPIKAAGDGRVIFRGRKGGYGKAVVIQHGSQYTTLYAHMSKFRGKVKNGSRVKQGQVIGYVGKSGLATGPHLHYEFRVNGVHRNPLKVKLPAAEPIAKQYRADFTKQSAPLLARLDLLSNTMVAEAE